MRNFKSQYARQVGEHLVVAELGRREIVATPFAGNMPDIDNDRRKAQSEGFIPQRVPRTDKTEAVLARLKQEVFPALEIEKFLTPVPEFNLIG